MNTQTKKYILVGLIVATGLFDFFSFYFGRLYAFEINPIFVITKSIWLIFLLKFAVLAGLSFMILRKRQKTYFSSYTFALVGIYIIIAQVAGGVSNINTTIEQPSPDQALQPTQAIETFAYLSLLLVYYPLIMALLAFKLWEWIYMTGIIKRVDYGIRKGNN